MIWDAVLCRRSFLSFVRRFLEVSPLDSQTVSFHVCKIIELAKFLCTIAAVLFLLKVRVALASLGSVVVVAASSARAAVLRAQSDMTDRSTLRAKHKCCQIATNDMQSHETTDGQTLEKGLRLHPNLLSLFWRLSVSGCLCGVPKDGVGLFLPIRGDNDSTFDIDSLSLYVIAPKPRSSTITITTNGTRNQSRTRSQDTNIGQRTTVGLY